MNLGIDPCLSNPCLNRGECIQLRYGRYKCECAGKFFWTEIDVYIFIYIRFYLYFFFGAGTNFYGDKCQKGEFFSPVKIYYIKQVLLISR